MYILKIIVRNMEYYILKDGQYVGPFPKDQLIANGLKHDTMVWRQGLTIWTRADLMRELDDVLNMAPPPLEQALAAKAAAPPPLTVTLSSKRDLRQELDESRKELEELKQMVSKLESEDNKPVVKETTAVAKKESSTPAKKKETTAVAKKDNSTAEKKKTNKKKTKYDYPVCTWFNETIFLIICIIAHLWMGLAETTTKEPYVYIDIIGLILCIAALVIALSIKKLNKISYAKNSESRIKADKLAYFNGFLVSTLAAIGFLIILVQSAHYVYVS